ncbi:MAG: ABC transporter ATP-binding protein [Gammaproteobacteria bacterium]|nr:ABC transporter ATP-binding protein [Gammaproteobacteria bacterium]NNM21729.1 ABC transporter ATP-binding protein [Gammaproteobacteria bacterium]
MNNIVTARGLRKRFGDVHALDGVDFSIPPGRIVGLIGPNGAGKTTALKAILGLTRFEGELDVLGCDPYRERAKLMQSVCFIADVAILPRWLKVSQALDFVAGVHPRFNRDRAEAFLARTNISRQQRVRTLSKGMVAQLHLALVMAIDVQLLVLDEPTLGLDILYRKKFYETLLNDYFDEQRTIVVTTHQVEEVENILTDLLFINNGRIVLNESMDDVAEKYVELLVKPEHSDAARALGAIHEREVLGKRLFLFQDVARDRLSELGELHRPSIADLFVAKMQGVAA